jgi:hypothetical protein
LGEELDGRIGQRLLGAQNRIPRWIGERGKPEQAFSGDVKRFAARGKKVDGWAAGEDRRRHIGDNLDKLFAVI